MRASCFAAHLAAAAIASSCLSRVALGSVLGGALTFDEAAAKNRPVSKVITLLKDMLKQLEKEAEEDEQIYDKMACWCETNDKEKTKAIADAEARISDLQTQIEEGTALSARLSTEIKNLEKEVAKNQEALSQATAIRQKELAAFNAEEKDLLESISALKAAIVVLSKHHGGSMLQAPKAQLASLAAKLRAQMDKHRQLLVGALSPAERKAVDAFLQAPQDYFDSAPTFKQSYAPQSGQIFGILKQMKETFEADLSDTQKQEMSNQKAYEELKAAKEEEIAAGQAQLDTKTQELATTDEKLAQAKEDVEDTKASLAADEQFLMSLKEKCAMTDKEWEARQKTRHLEMEAVSKALAILSSDDAHDTFTSTFNPAASLLQRGEDKQGSRRAEASSLLVAASRRLTSPRLATLAATVRLDAFTQVKEAIDKMISELAKEKADEIKHKDFCVDELNQNQLQTERKEREKQDVLAKIEDLKMTVDQLTNAIDSLKAEIAEMQLQLKRGGEDREKENKVFQTTVADQRETQKLLQAALKVLGDFYGKKGGAALVQKQAPAGPAPPPGFGEYKSSGGADGVMGLLQQIINDAKAMETETVNAENDAQKAYEGFVKETNLSIETKSKDIVDKSETKAQAEGDLVEAETAKEGVLLELEQLSNYNGQLHSSCDFIIKNFDARQAARDEEIEALRSAKAILSGAKFEEFLQASSSAATGTS